MNLMTIWSMQNAYLESMKVRRNTVGPHFLPLDDVSSPFGVFSHRACSVSLVVVVRPLLGVEGQAP
jgi:hypothetical protein